MCHGGAKVPLRRRNPASGAAGGLNGPERGIIPGRYQSFRFLNRQSGSEFISRVGTVHRLAALFSIDPAEGCVPEIVMENCI
jgi:hypothetical protein